MKFLFLAISIVTAATSYAESWSRERFESFLRNSGRFFESDYDDVDEPEIPSRQRDAMPLFADVMAENGWSTNDLVVTLIDVVSNGLQAVNWESLDTKRTVAVAVRQLSDINHPAVTNYFVSIISNELHGLEKIVAPSLFKYTQLEPEVMGVLWNFSMETDRYDKAASIVTWELLDCLSGLPESKRPAANQRVARFLYHSMRQVSSSQTWQDEQLAILVPSYSNSVERLEQMRFLMHHSSRAYERDKATAQFDRLSLMPTSTLNSVQWITESLHGN